MLENALIYLIVAAAFLYLGRWLYKNIVSHKKAETNCASCPSCESTQQKGPSRAPISTAKYREN